MLMPELGETWSVMETEGDHGRLEAVVIATGPTMVRLVTRSGRRITFPASRWETTWSFVHAPPAESQQCSSCRQSAFFRHTVGGETIWVCEDHVPHGARAYFPGDAPGPPGFGLTCPQCESNRVEVDSRLITLSGTRVTTRCTCGECQCCWSALVGRGLGDDGTILAGDLTRMIQENPSISEVWLGFVAYRNLCRAVGMGDVAHIRGVPLHSMPSLADALAVVFFTAVSRPEPNPTSSDQGPPPCRLIPMPCAVGETWIDLENPKRQGIIDRVDPALGRLTIRWASGSLTTLTTLGVEELVARFRRLDVRSYWEMLDSEDDP